MEQNAYPGAPSAAAPAAGTIPSIRCPSEDLNPGMRDLGQMLKFLRFLMTVNTRCSPTRRRFSPALPLSVLTSPELDSARRWMAVRMFMAMCWGMARMSVLASSEMMNIREVGLQRRGGLVRAVVRRHDDKSRLPPMPSGDLFCLVASSLGQRNCYGIGGGCSRISRRFAAAEEGDPGCAGGHDIRQGEGGNRIALLVDELVLIQPAAVFHHLVAATGDQGFGEGAWALGIVEVDLIHVEGICRENRVRHLLPSFSSSSSAAGVTIWVELWRFRPRRGLSPVIRNCTSPASAGASR